MKPAILVLTSTYPRWANDVEPGFVHELSRRLKDDYEVHVLAPYFKGAAREEHMAGVQVHRFRYFYPGKKGLAYDGGMLMNIQRHPWLLFSLPFFLMSQLYAAWRIARRHRIALVHAHWVIPQGVVAWVLRLFYRRAPLVVTSHGGDVYGLNGRVTGMLKRGVYRSSAAVTVVSQAMAEELEGHVSGVDAHVAPMGVDLKQFFRPTLPLEGRRDVIFVGRLVEKKGVDVLLRAFAGISAARPEVRLRVVGHGPLRESLESLAEELGIGQAVEFTGPVPNLEVPNLLNQHAIAVVPSVVASSGDQEGLGLVSIEAMGCGCAVIASDLPAIRDVVTHEITGLMFPPGEVAVLADCLERVLKDEPLRLHLAEAGRANVLKKFDWEQAAQNYRSIFSRVGIG